MTPIVNTWDVLFVSLLCDMGTKVIYEVVCMHACIILHYSEALSFVMIGCCQSSRIVHLVYCILVSRDFIAQNVFAELIAVSHFIGRSHLAALC